MKNGNPIVVKSKMITFIERESSIEFDKNKIYRTIEYSTEVTPVEMAELFEVYDSKQQAEFFNHLAHLMKSWKRTKDFQINNITMEDLSPEARDLWHVLGQYAYENS